MNGRIGSARLADVVANIMSDHGFADFDVSEVHGFADGYVVASLTSARGALQALIDLHQIQVLEHGGKLIFRTPDHREIIALPEADIAEYRDEPKYSIKRIQETELPNSVVLEHIEPKLDFQPTATHSSRIEGGSERQVSLNAPIMLPQELAMPLVEDWLRAAWIGRNSIQLRLPRRYQHLQVGDHVEFDAPSLFGRWLIARIEEADTLSIDLRSVETPASSSSAPYTREIATNDIARTGLATAQLLDLPVLSGDNPANASRIAVSAEPWPGPHNVFSAPDGVSYIFRQAVPLRATLGELKTVMLAGVAARWDNSATIDVKIYKGNLSSQLASQVLSGGNVAAIRSNTGAWEVLQFTTAELIGVGLWTLSGFLRGQAGTEPEMLAGVQHRRTLCVDQSSRSAIII